MSKTIAIVDDDCAVRDSTATLVESAGYSVQTFASGDAFLAARAPTYPDCVVLDVRMSGASGFDVLRELAGRDDRPSALMVSGYGDDLLAVEAMKLGATDFLEKPYPPAALLAAIDRACAACDRRRRKRR